MKALLAVGENSHPRAVSDYLAARFDGTCTEVDVLNVVYRPRSPVDRLHIAGRAAAELRAASELVHEVAKRLADHGFRLVRTHVQHGVVADVILAASERWDSTSLLIGAPRDPDLLTTLGYDSVAHAVATRSRRPVEMLRTASIDSNDRNRVLIVTSAERLDDFPFEQVQQQSGAWKGRSLLRILATLPPANVARVFGRVAGMRPRLEEDLERRSTATARLSAVCRTLMEGAPDRIEADHRLVEGSTRQVALGSAKRLAPSLLVVDEPAGDNPLRRLLGSLSRAAVPLAAPCSVLLLRSGVPNRAIAAHVTGRPRPSPAATTRLPRAIVPRPRRARS
jgi:hypothetical protein